MPTLAPRAPLPAARSAPAPSQVAHNAEPAFDPKQLNRELLIGHGDGAAFGVMVGMGETYLAAFALAVGVGEVTAGLIASLPIVVGGLVQCVSPLGVRALRSYKRWVVICAALQAASFIPLVIAAVTQEASAALLFLVSAWYWGAGLATGPAWNTWMGRLVPAGIRAVFFARRTRLSQFAVLTGFLIAGLTLQWAQSHGRALWAFAAIFLGAALCRAVSVVFLQLHTEPARMTPPQSIFNRNWHVPMRRPGVGRLLAYLVCVQGFVQFSGPFFTPYMFEKLRLSYLEYMALMAVAFLAKVISLPAWGRFAQIHGARKMLWLGGVGIAPVSAMWIASDSFYWILFIQVAGGVMWAAYELAFFLLFFESIPEDERTGVLTLYNLANTTAWVVGAAAGGIALASWGATREAYLWLFGLSSVGRFAALLVLGGLPRREVAAALMGFRTLAMRPDSDSMDAPILPSLPDQVEKA